MTTSAGVFAGVEAATITGAEGHRMMLEVHVGRRQPTFQVGGLSDTGGREVRDRIRAVIPSNDLGWPNHRRITVNLAPTHQRKTGSALDLAMAIRILAADEQIPRRSVTGLGFLGALGVDGCGPDVPIGAAQVAAAFSMRIDTTADSWSSP